VSVLVEVTCRHVKWVAEGALIDAVATEAIDRELLRLLSQPESLLEREGMLRNRTSAKARSGFLNSAHKMAWGAGTIHHEVDLLALSHHLSLWCLSSRHVSQIIHWRNEVVNSLVVHLVAHPLVILVPAVVTDRMGVYLCGVMRL